MRGQSETVKVHLIPVCYELGEDIQEVADQLALTTKEVVQLHISEAYRCYAVGFCPGFPYLGYLPDRLSGISRRSAPRVRIAPGSVAITGRQTGIYPCWSGREAGRYWDVRPFASSTSKTHTFRLRRVTK